MKPLLLLSVSPASGIPLYRQLQDQFLELSRAVRKTTVFITHDIEEAFRVGSRVAIMRDGRIVLPDGMSYRVLVLPDTKRMSPAVARKIEQLVHDGATIIGPKPTASPSLAQYPACDGEVRAIADRLWDDSKVLPTDQLEQALPSQGPDFKVSGGDSDVRYIHRKVGDADVYFVSNQNNRAAQVECTFRVVGRSPA